jgi:hypothetical protein
MMFSPNFNEMSIISNISRIKYWRKHHSYPELLLVKLFWSFNLSIKIILSLIPFVKTKISTKVLLTQLKIVLTK